MEGESQAPAKNSFTPLPTWKNFSIKFYHASPIFPLHNNFHACCNPITLAAVFIFSCSHCSCTTFILTDVQYLQQYLEHAVFSFGKGSNGQNHSYSDYHHPIKKPSQQNFPFPSPTS